MTTRIKIPSSEETEQAVLGCLLSNPQPIDLWEDDFYSTDNLSIFKKIKEMQEGKRAIDPLTVLDELRAWWSTITSEYIGNIITSTYSSSALPQYCNTLKNLNRKRQQIRLGEELLHLSDGNPSTILNYAEKLKKVASIGSKETVWIKYDDVNSAYTMVQERLGKKLYGYSWWSNFSFIDEFTNWIVKPRTYRIGAPSNVGKAMPLYERVLTPTWFTWIGSLKVWDKINNSYWWVSNVTWVFPQWIKPIYRMKFSDWTFVDSCENHLWAVHNNDWNGKDYKVMEVKDLISSWIKNKKWKWNKFFVPLTTHTHFENDNELLIDPYVLWILLSEWNLWKHHIQITNSDEEVKKRVESLLPDSDKLSTYSWSTITYWVTWKWILYSIKKYWLTLKRSWEKFIPNDYLFSTITDRKELLEWLIDWDWWVDDSSYVYTTTSPELAEWVKFISQSLWWLVSINSHIKKFDYKWEKKEWRRSYDVRISLPFKLNLSVSYKNDIKERVRWLKKSIVAIDYIWDMECVCIAVDAKDHLYITTWFTLTHNTQFLYNVITNVLEQKNPDGSQVRVAFFTLENTREETLISLMCNAKGINPVALKDWRVDWDWDYLTELWSRLFIIDDCYEVNEIFSRVMSIKPDVVFLDYISLMDVKGSTEESKYGEYARLVPRFAKSQNLAWIDLSNLPINLQTNEEVRMKPQFYWSSLLKNNCDVAIHLMSNEEFKKTKNNVFNNKFNYKQEDLTYLYDRNMVDLVITKNRWGTPWTSAIYWANRTNWGKWREMQKSDLDNLWAKFG